MARPSIITTSHPNPLHTMTDAEVDALLTPEERADEAAMIQALEDGTITSLMTEESRRQAQASARMTLNALGPNGYDPALDMKRTPSTRISMRLTNTDLALVRAKASACGIPYQTFLRSIVHQYLTGQLVPASK